jgi:tetratricopeptide (TPR) repeat protein
MLPGRLQAAAAGLVNLREILSADYRSPAYNEANRLGIFYAESWALVHMLKFSKSYSPKFESVLDAIGRGEPSDQALEKVYGKSIEAIQVDLETYVHGDHFYEGVIHAKIEKPDGVPFLVKKDPLETAVLVAGIQSHGPHRDEAIKTLEKLAKDNPGKPAPLESLAWFYLSGPEPQLALPFFRQAFESGTRDAGLCFAYAVKFRESIPEAEYVAALRRATELEPELSGAQQLLAAYAFNTKDYPEAVTRLHLMKKLERAQACTYYRALSYAAFQIGNKVEARTAADRAQQYASTDEEHRLADEIIRYVSGAAPETKPPELPSDPQPQ